MCFLLVIELKSGPRVDVYTLSINLILTSLCAPLKCSSLAEYSCDCAGRSVFPPAIHKWKVSATRAWELTASVAVQSLCSSLNLVCFLPYHCDPKLRAPRTLGYMESCNLVTILAVPVW